ncbi:hypothetical protein [Desulforamulus ruminis]|uniref:Uncharacterized protein n=1 Tax=Desulforamulus ruminis (strain ATCC 23193 / DSM 2154 / NCIMB 8452 / DL) TaxID=696281 RepID=F6DRP1_DESRL|nr:hypothetical protein [Desulforamulus ruminis]AEG59802.1 hypothetical protein Desru_1537 [Desulforamulus ruminis DSM 2154]
MNKVKFLYDVVSTLKEKESFRGVLAVEGSRNQDKILVFNNEFEKSQLNGRTKAKVQLELDCQGKKIKHESSTEFDLQDCHGHRHHGFWHPMRHGHSHGSHHGPFCDGDGAVGGGRFKGKLSRLAFFLNVLNSMELEEQDDKKIVLSLNFDQIPGDMKNLIQRKMQHHKMHHSRDFQQASKEFSGFEPSAVKLTILVNQNKDMEKVVLIAEGKQQEEAAVNDVKLNAELRLDW